MKQVNKISCSAGLTCIGLWLALCLPSNSQTVSGGDRHSRALEWRRMRLQNEKGEIPADAWMKAMAQKKQMSVDPAVWPTSRYAPGKGGSVGPSPMVAGIQSNSWTWLGPGNIGGRVRSILINPTNANIMWVGGVGGGVWKTVNGGGSWFPLDDFMPNLAISCMVMDPNNPDVIYAGTGEGFGNIDAIQGAGIFKTTDGGSTWSRLPFTAPSNTSSFLFVNRLAISPTDSMIILAGTGSGIFRSTNGGNSWSQVDLTTTLDLQFDPTDGTKCIASGFARVAVSPDGGVTWVNSSGIPAIQFPAGRVEIAYAPSDPSIVYAGVDQNGGQVWKSVNGGTSFDLVDDNTRYMDDLGNPQGWYDNCIWVSPTDPNIVVVGGIHLWISVTGGFGFALIGEPHPDLHVIVNHPAYNGSSQRVVFIGGDGGVFMTDDIRAALGPGWWRSLNHNLGITQFYGVAASVPGRAPRDFIIGGTQDNGTIKLRLGDGTDGWSWEWDDDGGFCAVDPTDPGYYYGESQSLVIHRSGTADITSGLADSGNKSTANFAAPPFILDPNNPSTMLAGGWRLWRNPNVKTLVPPAWSIIKSGIPGVGNCDGCSNNISAIAVALGNSDVIWVGHDGGEVFATMNGTAPSPTWTRMDTKTPSLPKRICTRITIDPTDANLVYVTFGGFQSDNVWRTMDGGATWTSISHGLPQTPVYSLVVDPGITSRLYIGTEIGVFGSADGGANWSPSNDGPANVQVVDLTWMGTILLAATHGRGCYMITPAVWVDFSRCSSICGDGSFANPFSVLTLARDVVSPGGTVCFKPSNSGNCLPGKDCFPLTISKPMTFEAFGGPAAIGQ